MVLQRSSVTYTGLGSADDIALSNFNYTLVGVHKVEVLNIVGQTVTFQYVDPAPLADTGAFTSTAPDWVPLFDTLIGTVGNSVDVAPNAVRTEANFTIGDKWEYTISKKPMPIVGNDRRRRL